MLFEATRSISPTKKSCTVIIMSRWNENRITEACQAATESSRDAVAEHPFSSMMIAFGVGLGAGLALVSMLAPPPAPERLTERMAHQLHDMMASLSPSALRSAIRS